MNSFEKFYALRADEYVEKQKHYPAGNRLELRKEEVKRYENAVQEMRAAWMEEQK